MPRFSIVIFLVAGWLGASALPSNAAAQGRSPEPARGAAVQAPAPTLPAAGVPEADANAKRQQLRQVMEKYPPGLARVLKTDPTLMQEASYLSRFPALAAFLAVHPEVASNPAFYFEHVYIPGDPEPQDAQSVALSMWRNTFEALSVIVIMIFTASVLAWLVRTVLNHRRWLRLSKVQTEVHNKLLDRFSGTGELLTYVQTAAGRRFLEAAPIDVEVSGRALAAPFNRILWSAQLGVVLAVGGLGFLFVSGRVMPEVAQGTWLIGVLALAFGVGFVVSGLLSYVLSRRLGLLDPAVPVEPAAPSTP